MSHETIVNLIGSTTTKTGLRVRSKLDPRNYATGKKVPKAVMRELNIHEDDFHGEWNYTLRPKAKQGGS